MHQSDISFCKSYIIPISLYLITLLTCFAKNKPRTQHNKPSSLTTLSGQKIIHFTAKSAGPLSLPQHVHTHARSMPLLECTFYKLSKKPYANCTEPRVQSTQFLKGHNSVNWKLTFSPAEAHFASCFCSLSQLPTPTRVAQKDIHKQNGHKDSVWINRKLYLSSLSSE